MKATMIYVHHVPQHDAAERLSRTVAASGDFPSVVSQEERQVA
jgi:hypothetical protein